jgi:uncharacterized membrane protein
LSGFLVGNALAWNFECVFLKFWFKEFRPIPGYLLCGLCFLVIFSLFMCDGKARLLWYNRIFGVLRGIFGFWVVFRGDFFV